MSAQISFDRLRFNRAIDRATEKRQAVGGKRVGFACPECGAANRVTVEQIAQQASLPCAGCGTSMSMVDKEGGFGRTLRGA